MSNIKGLFYFLRIFFLVFLLLSCAKKKDEIKNAASEYVKVYKILEDGRYSEAAEKFEAIYDDYPLSKWAEKAQAIASYAYYKEERYEDVIRVVETFVSLNPSSEYIPYMSYMKSISYYNMIPSVERGQNHTNMSSASFRELAARYPGSIYINDVKEKIKIIDEHLAGSLMSVGRYQIKFQNYVGAIKHFSEVIYKYSSSNQAPEAYFRLCEIYYKLGMVKKVVLIKDEMLGIYKDGVWVEKIKDIKL